MTRMTNWVIMSDWSPGILERSLNEATGIRPDEDAARTRTRLRILQAATHHFLRFGYRKASISDIAKDAGVAKGTIYLYFESKNALMVAAISYEKVGQLEAFNLVMAKPPHEQLRAYLQLVGEAVQASPLVARLTRGDKEMLAVLEDAGQIQGEKIKARRDAFLTHLIRSANPSLTNDALHKRVVVLNAVVMMTAQLEEPALLQDQTVSEFSETLADMIVSGIAHRDDR
ncbi:MAG: AcrR family transcriptional regulator [Myxococcota bacterium]|jgi:AcrR family transcriptional regulator